MNEIFVKPAVGAIITKQTDNNEFILVQNRKRTVQMERMVYWRFQPVKSGNMKIFLMPCVGKYGRKQDFILHKYRAKKTAIL